MFRKVIPLAVAVVLVVGCKKKEESGDGGGGDGSVDSDPSVAYTIKLRGKQTGDKVEVIESESMSNEKAKAGKSESRNNKRRFEYTEQITEMPAGADKPTKLTRAYKIAERTDFKTKEVKPLSFQGKTVVIEKDTKSGGVYKFTVDGKPIDFMDTIDLDGEFRSDKKGSEMDAFLPKQAVKVGDTWTVQPDALKALTGGMSSALDKSRSKFTCKLARAYTKDGKQWATISFDFDIFIDVAAASKGKETGSGSVKIAGTIDAVIDGSARDVSLKGTMKGSFSGTDKLGPASATVDGSFEETTKTAK